MSGSSQINNINPRRPPSPEWLDIHDQDRASASPSQNIEGVWHGARLYDLIEVNPIEFVVERLHTGRFEIKYLELRSI